MILKTRCKLKLKLRFKKLDFEPLTQLIKTQQATTRSGCSFKPDKNKQKLQKGEPHGN